MSLFAKYGTGESSSGGNGGGETIIIEKPPYDMGNFTISITNDNEGRPIEEKFEGDINRTVKYAYAEDKVKTETIIEKNKTTVRNFTYDTKGYLTKIEVTLNEVM